MARLPEWSQKIVFTVALTCISRVCPIWDRLHGRLKQSGSCALHGAAVFKLAIPSGRNLLDAVLAKPASAPIKAAVLICHGIGETLEYWPGVQQFLAADGIASLVFDYSGYGRSSGWIAASQCERDAVAAFHTLQQLVPGVPVSLLGFSLGSGIAAAVVGKIPVHRLALCAVFTSFRAAALSIGFPRGLIFLAPGIWRTIETVETCSVPVLIVHGENDELFPVGMARELKNACRSVAELAIVPGLSHNQPHSRPTRAYWSGIVGHFLLERSVP